MKTLKKLILPLLFLTFIFSCDNSNSGGENKSAPSISVKLVDAPGDFKAVNVEIVDVMIKMDDDTEGDNGWMSLEVQNETVNLLDFTGGLNKVLVDRFPIPEGTLSQMRLVLGDGNTIVIENDLNEDKEYDLKTPSAQQSGLKLKVNAAIEAGYTYDFILDFDVEKSIVNAGNSSNIILKPVLYVSTEASSGIIEGIVEPSDVASIVTVLVDDMGTEETDDDFIISANTDESGAFALWGVPEGTYDVIAMPLDEESDYTEGSALAVSVINGQTTIIGDPIQLDFKPGSISGDVTNDIVVTVTVKDSVTEEVVATIDSNANGEFLFEEIPVGVYTVTISATDYVSQIYSKDSSTDVLVTANTETVLDVITLEAI
ncbi:DUF4382 domain-containing protein [Thalassobellus suaedae]|uniref:DUF4382 domain-containing protein n=1 Tax=Thalassobellus suaedae TaxID=3074124 RepID=A0ABY9Y792_9FLAO|nr:DUF4382 domain-containing protein [Flavobacteriaceae bacterium HL-DH10]